MHENDSYTKLITEAETHFGKSIGDLIKNAPIEDKINVACNVIGLSLESQISKVSCDLVIFQFDLILKDVSNISTDTFDKLPKNLKSRLVLAANIYKNLGDDKLKLKNID